LRVLEDDEEVVDSVTGIDVDSVVVVVSLEGLELAPLLEPQPPRAIVEKRPTATVSMAGSGRFVMCRA
jgi:hypothetical protein